MAQDISPLTLRPCPKGYTADLDKSIPPEKTLKEVKAKLDKLNFELLAATKRIDLGRLNIPVYASVYSEQVRQVIPKLKQMGKGSSPAQAEASAIMELIERFSYYTFWERRPNFKRLTYSQAANLWGANLLPLEEILLSVHDNLDLKSAQKILDLCTWDFAEATDLKNNSLTWIPVNWFKLINEYNGSAAGNSLEESLLQALCELIERHVCCQIARLKRPTPTLILEEGLDPTLDKLLKAFRQAKIELTLKDFSQGFPLPTIAALAYDPKTFPQSSEIVFTAGTASSPTKAAIRALTEVAQLGGDFCTNSCYEASGLPKYNHLKDLAWLKEGPTVSLTSLKDLSSPDITQELQNALKQLPYNVYALDLTHPDLNIWANYLIIPGFDFLQRSAAQSLGLFVGRRLMEEEDPEKAFLGLKQLEKIYGPNTPFVSFYLGQIYAQSGQLEEAQKAFTKAAVSDQCPETKALSLFFQGYLALNQENYTEAQTYLEESIHLDQDNYEAYSFLGQVHFKKADYEQAKEAFLKALSINKSSSVDLANLGICEKFLNQKKLAKEHLEAALAYDQSLEFAKKALQELEEA
ncbi:MAG: YcaO-like family protein [Desulfovibrionaceae bacterium]|nr:YcaO-like family protein [Desulfovibrionaceae bacterium]